MTGIRQQKSVLLGTAMNDILNKYVVRHIIIWCPVCVHCRQLREKRFLNTSVTLFSFTQLYFESSNFTKNHSPFGLVFRIRRLPAVQPAYSAIG